jgi:hypothetical protein
MRHGLIRPCIFVRRLVRVQLVLMSDMLVVTHKDYY